MSSAPIARPRKRTSSIFASARPTDSRLPGSTFSPIRASTFRPSIRGSVNAANFRICRSTSRSTRRRTVASDTPTARAASELERRPLERNASTMRASISSSGPGGRAVATRESYAFSSGDCGVATNFVVNSPSGYRNLSSSPDVNRNLYLVFAAIFCLFATQTVVFVLIPLAAAAMELPGVAIGVLVAVLAGLGLASDVLVSFTSYRLWRNPLILTGAGLGVLAGILLAVAEDFPTLFAGAVALGLSLSFAVGPALAYVTEACRPEQAARVQGYNGAVQGLSALAGAFAIGFAIDHLGTGRSSLLISVVIVVGNSFLPIYIVRDLGQSAVLAGTLLAARNVAMTVASPLFGVAVSRFGLVATMLGTNALAVLGMVGVALAPDPQLLYIPLALAGFGTGFAAATANTLVTSATGRHERALGFATNSLVGRAGSLMSPLIFGTILEVSGSPAVFSAAAILGVAYIAAMAARMRLGTVVAPDRFDVRGSEETPIARPVGD